MIIVKKARQNTTWNCRWPLYALITFIIFPVLLSYALAAPVHTIQFGLQSENNSYTKSVPNSTTVNFKENLKNSNKSSISVNTNKARYIQDEFVHISGNVDGHSKNPDLQKVVIQVYYLPNSSDTSAVLAYKTSFYPTNGTFQSTVLNTVKSGTYRISATLEDQNETAWTTLEVENPFTILTTFTIYLGIGIVAAVLYILAFMKLKSVRKMEILNFILISSVAFLPIMGLLLADVELGPNSPIGLVLKHAVNQKEEIRSNEAQTGGQWVINIGGDQHDNYASGIQIPIYIVVFGIAGGYLRYLYKTKYQREEVKKLFEEIEIEIKSSTFTIQEKEKHRERLERRFWLFYSLNNLALLLLSPLLAIAVWFVLVQQGIEGNQGVQGQTGIFLLAAVSFTIGLVTDEVIRMLIRFTKDRLGSKTDEEKSDKSMLFVDVRVSKDPIMLGEDQTLTVIVSSTDLRKKISKSAVRGEILFENKRIRELVMKVTDENGQVSYTWTIGSDYQIGKYIVSLLVSATGYIDKAATATFEVIASPNK